MTDAFCVDGRLMLELPEKARLVKVDSKSIFRQVTNEVLGSYQFWRGHGDFVDPLGNSFVFRVSKLDDGTTKRNYEIQIYSCGLNEHDEDGLGDDIVWKPMPVAIDRLVPRE